MNENVLPFIPANAGSFVGFIVAFWLLGFIAIKPHRFKGTLGSIRHVHSVCKATRQLLRALLRLRDEAEQDQESQEGESYQMGAPGAPGTGHETEVISSGYVAPNILRAAI